MGHSVGRSSYGDLRGVEQFVSTLIVALQIASLCYEFDTQFPGARERGDRLTVNEGIRSKRRMEILRAAWETYLRYGTPWAALAAALYYSTHREEIGTAVDFGITTKDGSNRAMTAAEAEWVHQHGVPRGVVHTGDQFVPKESWHHNGGYPYTLPPIVGVNLPGEPLYTDRVQPEPEDKETEMSTTGAIEWADDNRPVLRTPLGSWPIVTSTIRGQRIETPQILSLLRRQIRGDQDKNYPAKFLEAERVILDYAYAQARKPFLDELTAAKGK